MHGLAAADASSTRHTAIPVQHVSPRKLTSASSSSTGLTMMAQLALAHRLDRVNVNYKDGMAVSAKII